MLFPITVTSHLSWNHCWKALFSKGLVAATAMTLGLFASASHAQGQVMVYETFRPVTSYYTPMAAGYPGGYMANYSPAGNYAAVTAYSPPVAPAYVANYQVAEVVGYPVTQVANYPVTQVANYPVTQVANYAAAPVAVTSYYSPAPVMAAPVYAAPVTTYYAPSAACGLPAPRCTSRTNRLDRW